MNVTDVIASTIKELLKEQGGEVLIQRNDFANKIGCVPSQINYVITSRFTQQQGYIVESRRGGGGFIRIAKVEHTGKDMVLHLINSLGGALDEYSARVILQNLLSDNIITAMQAKLILAAVTDANFRGLPDAIKQELRAIIFKSMLINCI